MEAAMTTTWKRIWLGIGAVLIAVTAASSYVAAQNNPGGGQPPMERRGPGGRFGGPGGPGGPLGELMLGALNLTDTQKGQVKSILDSHRDEMQSLGDKSRTAHQALDAAITADSIDESAIRARAADVGAVDADMAVLRAHIRAEVWQILTPEQQSQAKQMQADMQQRMQNRRGRDQKNPQ